MLWFSVSMKQIPLGYACHENQNYNGALYLCSAFGLSDVSDKWVQSE